MRRQDLMTLDYAGPAEHPRTIASLTLAAVRWVLSAA